MFGVKPELIVKGGFIAASKMGDANASIPTPQPVVYRNMYGAFGRARYSTMIEMGKACYERRIIDKVVTLNEDSLGISFAGFGLRSMQHERLYTRLYIS